MKLSPIIEITDLESIYKNPEVRLIDVRNGKNAKSDYKQEHLEGAIHVDLDTQLSDIKCDFADGGRHPLPTTEDFAQCLTELGISKKHHLILYDTHYGANAAARLWWMLKAANHPFVQVLNGAFQYAKKHNFPMSSKLENFKTTEEAYTIKQWQLPIIRMNEVEKFINQSDHLIIDVRSRDRYEGKFEPIDLIAGHIPQAINIPYTENLDENGLFLHPEKLKSKYEPLLENIKSSNIAVHCGSGVTACHTLLALDYAGIDIPNLYVGSWSEWSRNNKAIEKLT